MQADELLNERFAAAVNLTKNFPAGMPHALAEKLESLYAAAVMQGDEHSLTAKQAKKDFIELAESYE